MTSDGWEWDTPTARRIEAAVAAARGTATYRRAVRVLRVAAVLYLLALVVMCAPLGQDRVVPVAAGLVLLAGGAVPFTTLGMFLARRSAWACRPADADGRRHWAAEVSATVERDTLALWRSRR